jgi:hypothetical protein
MIGVNLSSLIKSFFKVVLPSSVSSSLISHWAVSKQQKKQNQYQDAKEKLPILLEILEDLEILEQAYIFKGKFCPLKEHRCPDLSAVDGDALLKLSYAQRVHQFRIIGHKLIRNCRRMVYLTPKGHLPNVLMRCSEIKNFLCHKEFLDSKTYFDLMIGCLLNYMAATNEKDCPKIDNVVISEMNKFVIKLREFYDRLDEDIQKELPNLGVQ